MMTGNKRGGKRAGGGRKKLGRNHLVCFRVSDEVKEMLQQVGNKTEFIEEAIKNEFNKWQKFLQSYERKN